MHTGHHQHGCGGHRGASAGPEVFYGYCHDTGRMRMMNYPDYVQNVQTGMSNLMQSTAMHPAVQSAVQSMMNPMSGMLNPAAAPAAPAYGYGWQHQGRHHHHGHHDHDCGCHGGHEHHHDHDCGCHGGHGRHHDHDCGCHCCVHCADLVEYARCGEIRRIPVTFDNDTRRNRDVKLTLGPFATQSGQETGWAAELSDTTFTLGPCGEKTIVVSVRVDCSKFGPPNTPPAGTPPANNPPGTTVPPTTVGNAPPGVVATPPRETQTIVDVDSCKVAYASLTAEGCSVRPLVLAVAVLPQHCYAHQASCGCGCCCN